MTKLTLLLLLLLSLLLLLHILLFPEANFNHPSMKVAEFKFDGKMEIFNFEKMIFVQTLTRNVVKIYEFLNVNERVY